MVSPGLRFAGPFGNAWTDGGPIAVPGLGEPSSARIWSWTLLWIVGR
jgi:hypothetical protein